MTGPLPLPPHQTTPCPYLPVPESLLDATCVSALGNERGPRFYEAALLYAQSLWLQGFPARSILLLNRALGAEIKAGDAILTKWPLPYRAIAWLLLNHAPGQFIGNPRRHWQHLATRMSGPRAELRTWRAWACWHMACLGLPDCPADEEQIADEGIREPSEAEIIAQLAALGHPDEIAVWRKALDECASAPRFSLPPDSLPPETERASVPASL